VESGETEKNLMMFNGLRKKSVSIDYIHTILVIAGYVHKFRGHTVPMYIIDGSPQALCDNKQYNGFCTQA
jgi:hypothetical protein